MSRSAWAVIVAGGTGQRFSETENKLLLPIQGKPVFQWTLEAFLKAETIEGVVIVSHPQATSAYSALADSCGGHAKPIYWACGGPTRRASVCNGLMMLPEPATIVAIHDAARPLITPLLINQSVEAVEPPNVLGVVVSLPVVDTLKKIDPATGHIQQTLDRRQIWRAQTPQTFCKASIMLAHQSVDAAIEATDDAQLMELAGLGPVRVLAGTPFNLKITTPEDIILAEQTLQSATSALSLG